MKRILSILNFILLFGVINAQNDSETLMITDKLQLIRISDNAFIHLSYLQGSVPCNGLILVDKDKAFLFDTPCDDSTTQILLTYIKVNLKLQVTGFLTNDWHIDSQGGLGLINKLGITSYANEMTRQIAREKGLPVTTYGFKDSLKINFGDKLIECFYPGPAHTMDNILVWIPSERILFADCLIKELAAKNLGYTADGDVNAYPETLKKIMKKFSNAQYVIPGHGKHGGFELITHTMELTNYPVR
jgi:metallo-beta-lactamase class B